MLACMHGLRFWLIKPCLALLNFSFLLSPLKHFRVNFEPQFLSDWGALGGIIGARSGAYNELPVIDGIASQPGSDELKHFGAAMAKLNSVN